jgi:hypothetical protein
MTSAQRSTAAWPLGTASAIAGPPRANTDRLPSSLATARGGSSPRGELSDTRQVTDERLA